MTLYIRLFFEFFKIGLFAVGGGMATVPFLYKLSDATGWFSYNELTNMIAVGESTPGPIGVNMATYVGYITGMSDYGVFGALLGAVIATLGLITPSVIVILIVAMFLKSFRDNRYVNGAFYGLRPTSTGLIAAAGLSVAVSNLFYADALKEGAFLEGVNFKGLVLAVLLWIFTNKVSKTKKLHPIIFIAASAVIGVLFSM
ncbi:MAG: chromate transporter [Ruminococcaceae bacterium]|nr:chromate transporter [Oscillospiraceae bacterium]